MMENNSEEINSVKFYRRSSKVTLEIIDIRVLKIDK